jgi:hypothetical protein
MRGAAGSGVLRPGGARRPGGTLRPGGEALLRREPGAGRPGQAWAPAACQLQLRVCRLSCAPSLKLRASLSSLRCSSSFISLAHCGGGGGQAGAARARAFAGGRSRARAAALPASPASPPGQLAAHLHQLLLELVLVLELQLGELAGAAGPQLVRDQLILCDALLEACAGAARGGGQGWRALSAGSSAQPEGGAAGAASWHRRAACRQRTTPGAAASSGPRWRAGARLR